MYACVRSYFGSNIARIGIVVAVTSFCSSLASHNLQKSQRIGSAVRVRSLSTVSTINRQLERQRGLLMLLNCTIAKSDEGKSVAEALGNKASFWPKWLFHMDMSEKRELAVPLVAGLSPADRAANVLVVQLMHVRVRRFAQDGLPRTLELCNCASKGGGALSHFRRLAVGVVMSDIVLDPFQC